MATNTTAFIINGIQISNERFQLEISYYYNYDSVGDTWTNTETYTHDIHVTELNLNYNINTSNSAESCEVNGKNKCLLRFTSDMIELSGNYNNPVILYNYIISLL
jgi:hypothetical protein